MQSRRDFLRSAMAVAALASGPAMRSWANTQPTSIDTHFAALMAGIGLNPADTGGTIRFLGHEPLFPSATPLATAFALPAMACAAGAAIAWKARGGTGQDLEMDIGRAAHGIFPEITTQTSLNGKPYPGFETPNPIEQAHAYEARSGRYIYVSAVYPHQAQAWIRFLGCEPTKAAVRAAVRNWDAWQLEEEANALGLTACVARTPAEWLAHPQGELLARTPLIHIRKLGESAPEPWRPGTRPLAGVRVLAATHAIAGPTVGRTLAEHGADVLQFNRPDDFEHEWVYLDANVGSRSTFLDLNDPRQHAVTMSLLEDADVFVDNYRGRALGRFGLAPEDAAQRRPGIIVVTIRCYGWEGPWAMRGGFDMLGSAASGLTVLEAVGGRPSLPATLLINDHIAGYLGAAGAIAALIRRAREGGSYHVSISLARAAMWYQTLGMMDRQALHEAFAMAPDRLPEHYAAAPNRLPEADLITRQTPLGEIRRLAPAVKMSATPANWDDPILVPKGSSAACWRDTSSNCR